MPYTNLVDCTLRDGGYYNSWDFSPEVLDHYFKAMAAISVDYVEIGFRTLITKGFKGGCGYSTDDYIRSLNIPSKVKLAVMINGAELLKHSEGPAAVISTLFTHSSDSPVSLVRIACHLHEIEPVMPAVSWLKENGYLATINFMQIADRTDDEIANTAKIASNSPLDVFYFADSLGSLDPDQVSGIIKKIRQYWKGEIGIHTHDNKCLGVANSMRAIKEGVTWVDGTVTGMGRGPGNAQIEYLVCELANHRQNPCNPTKLFSVINQYFKPMQTKYGWGPNPFYYLAGKHGIHPTYIQEMIGDTRYDEEDILSVVNHLQEIGAKKFNLSTMEAARHFYDSEPKGTWSPLGMIAGRDVLILGAGPGVAECRKAIERYIRVYKPFVIALNTQAHIDSDLIDIRAACHPMRLLADCEGHANLPQPLVTPASQLPVPVIKAMGEKQVFDFGLQVKNGTFLFNETHCTLPTSLVVAYALAFSTSGKANKALLAGFYGYGSDDPRTIEMNHLLEGYKKVEGSLELLAITPTKYNLPQTSVYAL